MHVSSPSEVSVSYVYQHLHIDKHMHTLPRIWSKLSLTCEKTTKTQDKLFITVKSSLVVLAFGGVIS